MKYELRAAALVVWTGKQQPTRAEIDAAFVTAAAQGWTGAALELFRYGRALGTFTRQSS